MKLAPHFDLESQFWLDFISEGFEFGVRSNVTTSPSLSHPTPPYFTFHFNLINYRTAVTGRTIFLNYQLSVIENVEFVSTVSLLLFRSMSIFVVSNGSTGSLKRRFINENVNESINDNEWHGLAVGFIVFPYVLGMRHVPMLSTSFTSITAPLTLLFVGLPPTGRNGIQSHLQSAQSQPGKRATHGRVRASRQRRNYVSPSLFFFFF